MEENVFLKHPTQGFIKGVKASAISVIEQLKNQGWFRCNGLKDATPYVEKKKTKKKTKKAGA